MKIIIFGASGKLGSIIVQQALEQGHKVTAFVRSPAKVQNTHTNLTVIAGDIYQQESVAAAIKGHDAVISALGRRGFKSGMICRDGIKSIISAMTKHNVMHLVAVSAFGTCEHRNFSLYTRLLWLGIPKHMRDKDQMEELIRASQTEWAIVRPAAYLDLWPRKSFKLLPELIGIYPIITRQGVAKAMVDALTTDELTKKATAIKAA